MDSPSGQSEQFVTCRAWLHGDDTGEKGALGETIKIDVGKSLFIVSFSLYAHGKPKSFFCSGENEGENRQAATSTKYFLTEEDQKKEILA